jgi:threonine/homoserine/homoserine lactone efflux protein
MRQFQNIFVGFLVSFLGSLPLGYLNIIGLQIYQKSGLKTVFLYILGISTIEIFVIYFTLIFAKRLSENQKLIKHIELFSIFFIFLLGFIFYYHYENKNSTTGFLSQYLNYSAYSIGLIGNCFNVMQLPFWSGWNLYLLNNNYIAIENKLKYWYLLGTLFGLFLGMLALINGMNQLSLNFEKYSIIFFKFIIPTFFITIAFFQTYQFYKKYYKLI